MSDSSAQGTVTILFSDVEGSTALRTSRGDAAAHKLLTAQEETLRRQFAEYGGREIKATGDGFMVAFSSARRAIGCALGIQEALASSEIRVRIGLNAGEAIEQDGDLFGEAVNAAARVMAKARGGEVLVSEVVRQLAGTMPEVAFAERGRHQLKGFEGRWKLFAVARRAVTTTETTTRRPTAAVVGRTDEIAFLRSVLQEGTRGIGRVVAIEGEAGIGKSRLGRAAADMAKELGFQPFVGSAHELERERAFGPIVDALGLRVSADDPARQDIARLLDDEGDKDKRFPIIERIIELVESIAIARPVFVLVEDLHWADPSTILALHRLANTIPVLPVVIVCTARPEPRTPELSTFVNGLGPDVLVVEPLNAEAVAELAAATLGATPGPQLLAQLGGAAGNPLFVSELLAALEQEGLMDTSSGTAEVDEVSMPPSLRLTILRRLSSLSEPTLDILRIASILGSVFSLGDLGTVAGKSVTELLPLLHEAEAMGLVAASGSRLRFRHDLVRSAIYEDMLEPVRRALHMQAARALAATGTRATWIATHAAIGADVGDLQAAEWLRAAANEVGPRSPSAAIDLLERALVIAGDETTHANDIRLTLAWIYGANDRNAEAAEVARDVLAHSPARTARLAAQRVLFRALPWRQTVAEIDRALDDPSLEAAERARLVGERALALRGNDNGIAIAEAERAIELSTAAGDGLGLFLGTVVKSFCLGFRGDFDEALRVAADIEPLAADVRYEHSEAAFSGGHRRLIYIWSDRFEDAERELEAILAEGADAGEKQTELYHYAKSHLEVWAGRWDEAVAVAEAGANVSPDFHHNHQLLAYIAIHRGDLAAADFHLSHFSRAAWIPALIAEAKGETAALAAVLESYRNDSITDTRPWNIGIGLWNLPDFVRLFVATGDSASAVVVTRVLEEAAPRARTPTARGAALRCRGLVDRDTDALLAAVDAHRAGPRPFDLAEACEWAGVGLSNAGLRRDDAVSLIEEALRTYESVGAARDVSRAEAHLRRLGVRRGRRGARRRPKTGWESLTPSEMRVTALVAEKLSYREIGDRLFISRRTVETHIVHIFGKLALASRGELADLARERGVGADALAEQA